LQDLLQRRSLVSLARNSGGNQQKYCESGARLHFLEEEVRPEIGCADTISNEDCTRFLISACRKYYPDERFSV